MYKSLSDPCHSHPDLMYENRVYRERMKAEGLDYFRIVVDESDLQIAVNTARLPKEEAEAEAMAAVLDTRSTIGDYGARYPEFLRTLEPMIPKEDDPPVIKRMKRAAKIAGVGPMAAVAGAVSAVVGERLMEKSDAVIVENGGDLFLKSGTARTVAIDAGASVFSGLSLKIAPGEKPLGICTSSGTVGHSLSFGRADAATVLSRNVYLADAVATALGNRVRCVEDVEAAMDWAKGIDGVTGILILIGDKLGAWGDIQLA